MRGLEIHVSGDSDSAASLAAQSAAAIIRSSIAAHGAARIMISTGNSQLSFIRALVKEPAIEWSKVEAFHLDEYVGVSDEHPASFRKWIRTRFADQAQPRVTHYIAGDAPDPDRVIANYSDLLLSAPIDVAFVGIGENGHIAFNDPHVADFEDPATIKRVTLDAACRRQQVGEGHFPDLAKVPNEAITVSCPGLFRAHQWICCVPDRRKAEAVRGSLQGPVTTACPGSLVQRHPSALVFLDPESAALLSPEFLETRCQLHGPSVRSVSQR